MTLDELIEKLTEMRDEIDNDPALAGIDSAGDLPVTVAIQPEYPIAVNLNAVTCLIDGEKGARVWLATGSSPHDINPYAPRSAWEGEIVYPGEDCQECDGDGCESCNCEVCGGDGCADCMSTGKEAVRKQEANR